MVLLTEQQLRHIRSQITSVLIRQLAIDDWRLVLLKNDETSNTPIHIGLQTARTSERVFRTLPAAIGVIEKTLPIKQVIVHLLDR